MSATKDKPFATKYTHKTVALPPQIMGAVIADEWGIKLTDEQKSTAYVIGSPEIKKVIEDANR